MMRMRWWVRCVCVCVAWPQGQEQECQECRECEAMCRTMYSSLYNECDVVFVFLESACSLIFFICIRCPFVFSWVLNDDD
jgi:hypothetical protein